MMLDIRIICIVFLIGSLPVGLYSQVNFPLKTSMDGSFHLDQTNNPFPVLGRTAWCVISQSESSYKIFVENTVSHGFNAIDGYRIDPTNGKSIEIAGSPYANKGQLQFTPSGRNRSGENDWVLILVATE